jgi:hypothetical protein
MSENFVTFCSAAADYACLQWAVHTPHKLGTSGASVLCRVRLRAGRLAVHCDVLSRADVDRRAFRDLLQAWHRTGRLAAALELPC